jgi:transglutaminase-like putative cysteine protease
MVRVTGTSAAEEGSGAGRGYLVRHRTEYVYEDEVSASYGRAYLTPRDAPGQWTRRSSLDVDPEPALVHHAEDFFGNPSVYVEVHTEHTRLVVTAESEVEVRRDGLDPTSLDGPGGWTWEQARDEVTAADPVTARQFLLPSPQVALVPEVRRYAAAVFGPGRGVGDAVTGLVHAVYADFAYRPGATTVTTPLSDVLARREGVCQDFAHLAVACLRVAGLPARYVSGYLETQPPPGQARLQGADASHAWVSVLLPELGWVDLDPTNDRVVDDDYVVTAWGRDYTDVPPLKGVIFTESAGSSMTVEVDVLRREPARPPSRGPGG